MCSHIGWARKPQLIYVGLKSWRIYTNINARNLAHASFDQVTEMNDKEIERAELVQSLNAYLIPSSLFVACLIGAAGTFLLREGYQLGWAFIGVTALIIGWAFWAFICFQNKHRYEGRFMDEDKVKPSHLKLVPPSEPSAPVETTNFAPDAEDSVEPSSRPDKVTAADK